jgi:hypothetical protein
MKRELPELVPEEPFRLIAGRLFLCVQKTVQSSKLKTLNLEPRTAFLKGAGVENRKHHYPG